MLNLDGSRRVLYRLPELKGKEAIYLVEGERCVDALTALGIPATTSPMGAGKWSRGDYAAQLKATGVQRIAILPDNDRPGQKHAREVARSLMGAGFPHVRMVDLPGLPIKGDVIDFLKAHPKEELIAFVKGTAPLSEPPADPPTLDEEEAASPSNVRSIAEHVSAQHAAVVMTVPVELSSDELTPDPLVQRPAPLGANAYHGILGEMVELISPNTEADPCALFIQILVRFSACLGRTAYFTVGATRNYLNEFACIVGATGVGKGQGGDWSDAIFERCATGWACPSWGGFGSGESIPYFLRDGEPGEQGLQSDKRLYIEEPEFSSVLKVKRRESNILSETLCKGWDGKPLSNITKGRVCRATGVHMALLGHTTPEALRLYSDDVDAVSGFGNRFLWCYIGSGSGLLLPHGGRDVDLERFAPRLGGAYEHALRIGKIERDVAADALWEEVYPTLKRSEPSGRVAGVTGRAAPHVVKLSCLFAIADQSPRVRVT
ncbi:MAG TPA: hypothetical protein VMS40_03615, partial [Vicinamibacterales bacterium]|nr:hypothetical protein [Vicinamibacterales bacterium]